MKFLVTGLFSVIAVNATAFSHPHKCDHTHHANGQITWSEDCAAALDSRHNRPPHSSVTSEQHPHQHVKHGMLIFGTEEIFADHIVFKDPHNFQVILSIEFNRDDKGIYLSAKEQHPNDTFILLLDPTNIEQIAEAQTLRGSLLRRDPSEKQEVLRENIVLTKDQFQILYFNKLPF